MTRRSLIHLGLAATLLLAGVAGATTGHPSAGHLTGLDGAMYLPYKPSIVKEAQQELTKQGLYHGAIDGRLDGDTMHAIGDFQKKHGLSVSGVPTPQTRHALAKA